MPDIVTTTQSLTREEPPDDPRVVDRRLPNGRHAQPLFNDNSTAEALETLEAPGGEQPRYFAGTNCNDSRCGGVVAMICHLPETLLLLSGPAGNG